ncbi:MAG: glycoside hydrolase domain-containing protein, partial [Planctomycetota bacterium]
WGLYSDSSRWRRYPDAQVRAELSDIAAHGITTLMCYPPYHSEATYEDGTLTVNASEFVRYMRMAKEAGLRGPWVMSLQALAGRVRSLVPGKPLTDPEFKKVYQAYARHFADLAKREDWGECVWHTIDEPWSEDKQKTAAVTLDYLKELGLTTFTTAGPVPPEIDEVLDVRCYSIGHLLSSAAVLAEQRRLTAAAGDRLWFYGSGCYTGQDGNVIANRFITGFLFYKSGAEAEWSWTFLRTKGDVYNDFDGTRHREAKEACTVYPSTTQGAPTPTLQWEGIREGIDDYCTVTTVLGEAKRQGGEPERTARRELARLLSQVPVNRRPGDFTAADADRLRRDVVRIFYAHLAQ